MTTYKMQYRWLKWFPTPHTTSAESLTANGSIEATIASAPATAPSGSDWCSAVEAQSSDQIVSSAGSPMIGSNIQQLADKL